MPFLEVMHELHQQTEDRDIGGLSVSLGKSLGIFRVPRGFVVAMDRPISVPQETDAHGLLDILGRSVRFTMTTRFPVIARMNDVGLCVGTDDHHVTQMMRSFFQTHNREIRVRPLCAGDVILVNGQLMPKGIHIPLYPHQAVEFSAGLG